MSSTAGHPLRARATILVPVAAIRRERQPWHTRFHVCEADIRRLMRAIASTGEVVPIRILSRPDGSYDYVSGLLRLLAVERLGHDMIPAFVAEESDEELLLRMAIAEQETQVPLKTLDRGWALLRLQRMREERGLSHLQKDLAEQTGVDESDVSTALNAARAIPQKAADEIAREHGIETGTITTLAREPLRRIGRAGGEEERARLLAVACSALTEGTCATRAVREAHAELTATKEEERPPLGALAAVRRITRGLLRRLRSAAVWLRSALRAWRFRLAYSNGGADSEPAALVAADSDSRRSS